MTLIECVNVKFELVNEDDSKAVLEWLEKALSIKADDEINEKEIIYMSLLYQNIFFSKVTLLRNFNICQTFTVEKHSFYISNIF